MRRRTKRRPTIGMLICFFDAEYQAKIWNNIADAAIEYDVNLLFFVGKGLLSPYGYDSQHNIVYNLAGEQSLDGLIILSSTIGNHIPHVQLVRFCKQFQSMPLVCLGQSVKGIPSVMFDNEMGVKELIDHLVLVHGYKRIAFIKGTDTIQDAMIRYNTYKKTLHKHHIVFDPNLVAPGNFGFDSGEEAMRVLLEERRIRCDAVVASNDDMALDAYRYLQEKNIRVPQEMALAGFDDIKLVKNLNPPLTTISQPIYEQTRKALEIVLALIRGKKVPEVSPLASKLIIRQSCGCPTHSIAYVDSVIKYHVAAKKNALADIHINRKAILKNIIRELKSINIDNNILSGWLKDVLQSIITCIEKGDYQDKSLYNIIMQLPSTRIEVSENEAFWSNIIRILYFNILYFLRDNNANKLLELIYQKAKLLLSELFQRPDPFQSMNEKYMVLRLHDSNDILTTTFGLDKLLAGIALCLPSFEITMGYISLYKGRAAQRSKYLWEIPQESRLLLAFYNNQSFLKGKTEINFPTLELIPKKYYPSGKRHTLIVMPLFFKKEQFGFIIFGLGTKVEYIYEQLRGYISSSLKGALIFKKQIEAEELLKQKKEDLSRNLEKMRKAMAAFIKTMNSTMEVRDPYTANHQVRVSDLARQIGTEMKLDPSTIESIRMAGVIHDMGKICVPAEILNKPGRLTAPEFDIIKSHPQIAYDILKHIDFPWPIAQIIRQHHERLDGSGYPQHLNGKKILLEAKILAVADTVEAMATHRPYRPALGVNKALAEITKNRNILYNAEAVDACVKLFRKKKYKFT